jgi:hypothetical protein
LPRRSWLEALGLPIEEVAMTTTAVRWLAGLTTVLVLLQAILVGQALYLGDMTKLALHGWLGSGSFATAVLLVAAVFIAMRRGEIGQIALGIAIAVVLLLVAQLGLGYMGRRGGWAAAVHIPNGVLITGLLFALLATLAPRVAGPVKT